MSDIDRLSMEPEEGKKSSKGKNIALIVLLVGMLCGGGWFFYDDFAELFGISSPPPPPKNKPKQEVPKATEASTAPRNVDAGFAADSLSLDRKRGRPASDFTRDSTAAGRDLDKELGLQRDATVGRISALYAEQEELRLLQANLKLRNEIRELQRKEELALKKHEEAMTPPPPPPAPPQPPKREEVRPPEPPKKVEPPKKEPEKPKPSPVSIMKILNITGSPGKLRASVVTQRGVIDVRSGSTVGDDFIVNITRDGIHLRNKKGEKNFIAF